MVLGTSPFTIPYPSLHGAPTLRRAEVPCSPCSGVFVFLAARTGTGRTHGEREGRLASGGRGRTHLTHACNL